MNILSIKPKTRGPFQVALLVFYVLINVILFFALGVKYGADSSRYLEGAAQLFTSAPFEDKQSSYIGYILFVSLVKSIFSGMDAMVVMAQCVIGLIGIQCMFLLLRHYFDQKISFITCTLFLCYPDFLRWNMYILTDSLYVWSLCIYIYTIHRALKSSLNLLNWVPVIVMAIVLFFLRPNGWIIVPCSLFLLFCFQNYRKRAFYILLLGGISTSLCALTVFRNEIWHYLNRENLLVNLKMGHILWLNNDWRITMPADHGESMFKYFIRHLMEIVVLGVSRITATVFPLRPYFSDLHNISILSWCIVAYPVIAVGLRVFTLTKLSMLLVAMPAAQLFITAGTFADYDGRWLLYLFPSLIFFFANGIQRVKVIRI